MPKFGAQKHAAGASQGNRHPECDVPKRRPETLLQKRRPECDVPECRPKTALQNRRPKCGAGMQEPGREGGNAERNAGGGPGAGAAARIRHPKRGAECGGRSGSERETGVHRPEHGTGVRAGVRRQECGGRSAETGVRRQECRGRSAETGVRGPDARTGAREPECEPGCGGRSARPGAGAGVRGRVRTQNLR